MTPEEPLTFQIYPQDILFEIPGTLLIRIITPIKKSNDLPFRLIFLLPLNSIELGRMEKNAILKIYLSNNPFVSFKIFLVESVLR